MINILVNKIVDILEETETIQEEDKDIYQYGIEVVINNIVLMLIIFLTGLILHRLPYTMLFIVLFPLIRKYTGGYHAPKKWQCFLLTNIIHISIISFVFLGDKKMSEPLFTSFLLFAVCIIFIVDPIENKNNPKSPEEILKNREIARWLIVILAVTSFLGFQIIENMKNIFFTVAVILGVATCMMLPDYFKNGGI